MPNIDVINGQAEFINNHSLRVHRPEGNLEIHGEKIFINTGAQTVVPPIPGITTTPGVYDSTGLLNLKELPGHLGSWAADILALSSPLCSLILAAR